MKGVLPSALVVAALGVVAAAGHDAADPPASCCGATPSGSTGFRPRPPRQDEGS